MVNITQKNNKLMKIAFLGGFLLVISSQNINASEQFPDTMVYKGIKYIIHDYDDSPMESYFKKFKVPADIALNRDRMRNSALLRGYRAKYEIINNELILTSIETMARTGSNFIRVPFSRTKITTYTGKIYLPNGESTKVWMGFIPIVEKYIVLDINEGNLINTYSVNCCEYIEAMIQLYSDASEEYKGYLTGLLSELREREK
jgi:hypothetical protein